MNHIRPKQGKINRDLNPFRQLSGNFPPVILRAGTQSILAVRMSLYMFRLSDGETYRAEASCTHAAIGTTIWPYGRAHLPIPHSRAHSLAYKRLRSVLIDGLRPDEARSKTMAAGPSKGSRYASHAVLSSSSWARGSSLAHLTPHMSIMKST